MEAKVGARQCPKRSASTGNTPVKSKDRKSSLGLSAQSRRKGLIKKHKRTEIDRKQQKMKFKLGGNKIDPLNLMGLAEKDGSNSPKVESPALSDRGHKFEPGDVRPVDVTDPLKLNNLEDEDLIVKPHAHNKKRRKRKRRNTLTEVDNDFDKSADEDADVLTVKDAEGFELRSVQKTIKKQDCEGYLPLVAAGSKKENDGKDNIKGNIACRSSISEEDNGDEEKVREIDKTSSLKERCSSISADVGRANSSEREQVKKAEEDETTPGKRRHSKAEKANKKKNLISPEQDKDTSKKTCNRKFREKDSKYRYGNYNRYYGYRNANMFEDDRVQSFQKDWFEGKTCLDIGCNVGHLTLHIAKHFNPKSLLGVDIDETLIRAARNNIRNYLPTKNPQAPAQSEFPISFVLCHGPLAAPMLPGSEGKSFGFPYNVAFKTENYVDCQWSDLDEIKPEYDLILCLSITKWVHLNWGDDGLKKMFKKMFRSLKSDGKLVLEPQPWKSYSKKKNLTQSIREAFDSIKFKPDQFINYLLSPEVGFAKSQLLGVPKHKAQGFQRPIYVLTKGNSNGRMEHRNPDPLEPQKRTEIVADT
eukprot:gene15219-16793_t